MIWEAHKGYCFRWLVPRCHPLLKTSFWHFPHLWGRRIERSIGFNCFWLDCLSQILAEKVIWTSKKWGLLIGSTFWPSRRGLLIWHYPFVALSSDKNRNQNQQKRPGIPIETLLCSKLDFKDQVVSQYSQFIFFQLSWISSMCPGHPRLPRVSCFKTLSRARSWVVMPNNSSKDSTRKTLPARADKKVGFWWQK